MTLSEYSQLQQCIILAAVQNEKHGEILSSIKELFSEGINSVRRFEQINTMRQLLNVLEIRDILSEDNVECLKIIAHKLPNTEDLLKKITDYEECHVSREYGNFYTTPQYTKPEKESFIVTSNGPARNVSVRKKQRIFDTITKEIGTFWRDLGRNLNIRENTIDEIESHNQSISEKANKVLVEFEYERADPDKWFFHLCDALEKTRRKDLVRSIQEIMLMNI